MVDKTSIAEPKFDELVRELRAAIEFDYIADGVGYNRSAEALWKAALLAFNWVAGELGVTGFQASWAALHFYGQAMNIEGPFMIVKVEDALYPQYDLPKRLNDFIAEQRGWLAEEAAKKLADYEAEPTYSYTDDDGTEHSGPSVHPNVVAHWRSLVAAVL